MEEEGGFGPTRVFLFGNGLSLSFNEEHFRIGNITERARNRLKSMTGPGGGALLHELDQIAKGLDIHARRDASDFEKIAGPIDRLSNIFSELGPLSLLAQDGEEQAVLGRVSSRLRSLYKRVVGSVLEVVMETVDGNRVYLQVVADHLRQEAERQGELDVFTLNYDPLLERALLTEQHHSKSFDLADEFHGLSDAEIPVLDHDENLHRIPALRWRGELYYRQEKPLIRVHHLHGAGTWMRFGDDIYKARTVQSLRDCGLFASWAEGVEGQEGDEGSVAPVVLLGDQKETWVTNPPFNQTYDRLALAIGGAHQITVAGYGFRDEPLNRALREYREQSGARLHVIGTGDAREQAVRGLGAWRRSEWLTADERGSPGSTSCASSGRCSTT